MKKTTDTTKTSGLGADDNVNNLPATTKTEKKTGVGKAISAVGDFLTDKEKLAKVGGILAGVGVIWGLATGKTTNVDESGVTTDTAQAEIDRAQNQRTGQNVLIIAGVTIFVIIVGAVIWIKSKKNG